MTLSPAQEERARQLYREAIVVDACNTAEWDDEYLSRLAASGITCTVKTLASQHALRGTLSDMVPWLEIIHKHGDKLAKATSVPDIEEAKADGKVAVVYAFQNAKAIEEDLSLFRIFAELGVRVMQLTYNSRNYLGDGCTERHDGGLSDFGIAAVKEMNRLGILVDLSHVSIRTSLEAIEVASKPAVFSHSNCRALVNNPRNITDEQIKAVAAKGGVIGIDVYMPHLTEDFNVAPTLDDVMNHVDHIAKLVGTDHIGFGLDLGEGRTLEQFKSFNFPAGVYPTWEQRQKNKCRDIERIERFVNLARGLVSRGYSDADVRKILGGNFVRVFQQAWSV